MSLLVPNPGATMSLVPRLRDERRVERDMLVVLSLKSFRMSNDCGTVLRMITTVRDLIYYCKVVRYFLIGTHRASDSR